MTDADDSTVDRADFAARIVAIQRPLFAYILTLHPEPSEAEEILQNANLKLLAEQTRLPQIRNFEGWARRIAYYEHLAHCQRTHRCRLDFVDDTRLQELAATAFEHATDASRTMQALEHCERALPDRDRRLLDLRYRQSLSIESISIATRRTPAAIRQVLYRVRTALLDCLRHRLAAEGGSI